jgi:TetR/AcrR family transcriptional regulator, transcriptional repressor for nem operon
MGHAAAVKLTPKGRATKERIVTVASELMLERGVARTTIEDIQDAANVSTSQMYHYFGDKEDLVAAVIDLQSSQVLGRQQLALFPLDSIAALVRWRNAVVDVMRGRGCIGGCPIGSLANELSDTDPLARARLARAFAQWEDMIREGLAAIVERGELPSGSDVGRLAMAVLAGVQGGLLLSQLRRDTEPLEAALDTMIEHLRGMGVR